MARREIKEENKKKKTGITVDKNLLDILEEHLSDIGSSNRSRYIERLIEEDLEKRGININKKF